LTVVYRLHLHCRLYWWCHSCWHGGCVARRSHWG